MSIENLSDDDDLDGVRPLVRPGRPRRFPPEAERQLILDSAMSVMGRRASVEPNVTEILDEAGLSTRAFYRHFESKDELLRAMHRRETERASRRLVARVEAELTPRSKLEAWVDEMMSFAYDPRKAVRVALLSSDIAQRAADQLEHRHVRDLMMATLVAILDEGRRDGTFPIADPESHGRSIHALAGGLLRAGVSGEPIWPTRQRAVSEVLRFCLPALGVPVASAGSAVHQ